MKVSIHSQNGANRAWPAGTLLAPETVQLAVSLEIHSGSLPKPLVTPWSLGPENHSKPRYELCRPASRSGRRSGAGSTSDPPCPSSVEASSRTTYHWPITLVLVKTHWLRRPTGRQRPLTCRCTKTVIKALETQATRRAQSKTGQGVGRLLLGGPSRVLWAVLFLPETAVSGSVTK